MNTPTDGRSQFLSKQEHILLKRMLIKEISIVNTAPSILYQVPFELTTVPTRDWKEVLIETWHSIIQQKERISNTVIWVFNNRILINKVPSGLVNKRLETMISNAIDKTNEQMKLSSQRAI
jgi:hypothetical protein